MLTGLLLASLGGLGVSQWGHGHASHVELVILIVLAIGLVGYVLAGVVGKVFAEPPEKIPSSFDWRCSMRRHQWPRSPPQQAVVAEALLE